MILKVIIDILLCISLFFEIIEKEGVINILKHATLMSLICISISLYILCDLKVYKKNRDKILLGNIIYVCLVYINFRSVIVLLFPLIIDYIKSKKYSEIYILISGVLCVILQIKLGISYNIICLSLVSSMFVYESVKSTQRKEELEKINYNLREKIYLIEENRELENKLNLQNIETIKINERNLISQKIHDNIGHTIAGSIMQLEAVKIVANKDVETSITMIDAITNNLRKGMDEIRHTLRAIKPEQAEVGINELRLILDEFSKEYRINVDLEIEGDLKEVNIIYWRVIIDSLKETLTNTIKHGNGDYINLKIRVLNKIIRIHIKDNGNYSASIKKGMGLLGIEERIINVGGDVLFDNEDGFSTLIILKR